MQPSKKSILQDSGPELHDKHGFQSQGFRLEPVDILAGSLLANLCFSFGPMYCPDSGIQQAWMWKSRLHLGPDAVGPIIF